MFYFSKNNLLSIFYLVILFLAWPILDAHAATLSWSATTLSEPAGAVRVEIFLDTETAKINAVEGTIALVDKRWQLTRVSDANSLINFWIERPILNDDNLISFSGMTPGGYVGQGRLFDLTFIPTGATPAEIKNLLKVQNFIALLNDGAGAKTPVRVVGLTTTRAGASESQAIGYPEPFTPIITKSEALATSDRYVIFATQDKVSGLAHYAVYESWWPVFSLAKRQGSLAWIKTESPHRLSAWSPLKHVYVKAVNQTGGARIARVSPQFWLAWLYQPGTILVIILGVIILYALVRKKWH